MTTVDVELPEFKNCCFCCPLRPGLIAWGYIKLVLTIAVATYWILGFREFCTYEYMPFCVDSVFIIIFIVSAHRNDHKLMKVFYYYSFVIVFLSGAAVTICTIWLLIIMFDPLRFDGALYLFMILPTILIVAVNTMVQIYITVLIRSEILNLKYDLQCKFVKEIVQDDSETGSARQEKLEYGRLVADVVWQQTEKNMTDKF